MSFFVDKEWFYYLRGREILVYKFRGGAGVGRISQNGVFQSYDKELMYPDEDIANGLRIEYTRVSEPFVAEALETTVGYNSGIGISFADAGTVVSDSNNGFNTSGKKFALGDKIRIRGSVSNDGDYTLNSSSGQSAGALTITGDTFTLEAAGERVSITQIPKEVTTPDSTSHINLNKMLSLAVLDYCKGMLAERNGELDRKEYYMKEFYGKLGDNESNKRNISVTFPSGPFAVR